MFEKILSGSIIKRSGNQQLARAKATMDLSRGISKLQQHEKILASYGSFCDFDLFSLRSIFTGFNTTLLLATFFKG